jgi:hypothetical protein
MTAHTRVRSVLPLMMCFIPSFLLLGIVPAVVSAVFKYAPKKRWMTHIMLARPARYDGSAGSGGRRTDDQILIHRSPVGER